MMPMNEVYEVPMEFIPAGSFRMGDITGTGSGGETPVHEVLITRAFMMSRTQVTMKQYRVVMGYNPSLFRGPDMPVEQVSWYDAVKFCNELSRLEGLDPCYSGSGSNMDCNFAARGYRLPTEAEWEYACRAGTETDFHTGNMTHQEKEPLDPALDRAGWYGGNSEGSTHPVGRKEANAFYLYDMHGNVWEWCWDWYANNYYASSPVEDPRGPASGSTRVLRGGFWNAYTRSCRSAHRNGSNIGSRLSDHGGFRLVRTC